MIYMDVKSVTAPCGMDCFNCPMFVLKKESPAIRKRYYSGSMVLGEGPVLKSTNQ
jgi:hypothetical protein